MKPKEIWEHIDVGAHLRLLSGFPFASDRFSSEEGFPLIRIRDVIDSKIETYYRGPILQSYVIKRNDILIGMDGDFNVSRWKNQDALLNQRVLKVDASDAGKIDLNFIYYWLQPFIRKINEVTAATTVKHLSIKDIVKARDFLPPQKAQRKIARILQTIDRAIEQTEALIKKYQHIKAGLMHDLFTRGIGPDGQLRPPREQAPHLYQQSTIGWIPKEWDVRTLREMARPGVAHIKTGPFGSSLKGEHWVLEGIPVITIGALGEGEFNINELLFITERYSDTLVEYQMKAGEVVFSRVADVGRSVVIEQDQAGWIMSSNLMRIHLDSSKADPNYLQGLLSFDSRVKNQIRCKVNSGGRDVANSAVLNSLLFAWPSIEEQGCIVSRASSIDTKINKENAFIENLGKQKAGLMHDLLTGKAQVVPDLAAIEN